MFLSHPIILCLIFQLTIFVSTGSTLRENESELLPRPPDCGRQPGGKIGDGNKTLDIFPWMVLVMDGINGTDVKCEGFLISKRYVLTTIYCALRTGQTNDVVRLGRWDITNNPDCVLSGFDGKECSPKFIDIRSEKKKIKDSEPYLGLIRLSQEVIFNEFIQPICLPTSNELQTKSFVGKYLTATRTEIFNVTQKVQVKPKTIKIPVFDQFYCDRALRTHGVFGSIDYPFYFKDVLCVVFDRNHDDNLHGWYLMYKKQEWYALGIFTGNGVYYDRQEDIFFYTRIAGHIDWITDNMKP